jgi:hypothetical protein
MERLEPRLRQRILHWIHNEKYILESDIERRSIGSTACFAERLSHEPSPHEPSPQRAFSRYQV